VVQPAESDVVSPAVAADRPDALRNEVVGERIEPDGVWVVDRGEPAAKRGDLRPSVLVLNAGALDILSAA
jgi:hypothetical protein